MKKLSLHGRLYRVTAVREAAADFAGLARFKVHSSKGRIEVEIDDVDPEVAEVLVDEFLNFALAATVASRG
jgi:hypothetical protein